MNTVIKGDSLEKQVFEVFERQIKDDSFYVKTDYCKIFQKKGYYSKDREKDIIFDVSIEVTLPGQSKYSLLILFECKNYNHSVPVDDLEEFFSKIQQISGANTKGIVVTTSSFQSGAVTFANSKGIGLLRYFHGDNLEWSLPRSPSAMAQNAWDPEGLSIKKALLDENYQSRIFDLYGYVNGVYTVSSNKYFYSLIKLGQNSFDCDIFDKTHQGRLEPKVYVPYLEESYLDRIAGDILLDVQYQRGSVCLDDISELLNIRYGLVVDKLSRLAPGILGDISFSPNIIRIDSSQGLSSQMTRFTLAHEFGHLLLEHNKYMVHEVCHLDNVDLESPVTLGLKDINRMEWQANYFASCLLLPKDHFTLEFLDIAERYDLHDRGHGFIYLDDQRCNIEIFHKISSSLMKTFDVSKSVVQIRLSKLGYLRDVRKINEFSLPTKILA